MREDIRAKLEKNNEVNYEKVALRMRTAVCIADAMDSVGMTGAQLARKMGKSPSEISKWLSGTHNFTGDSLVEISMAIGVEINPYRKHSTTYFVQNDIYSPLAVFDEPYRKAKYKTAKRISKIVANNYSLVSCG